MSVVSYRCPVKSCRFHDTVICAEITHTKAHIRAHDYKILLETAYDLGIIGSPDERRGLDWLVDEVFNASKCVAGVALP